MEANRQKTQVVLQPTDKSNIVKIGDDLIYATLPNNYYQRRDNGSNYRDAVFQHMHLIETKEVKKGDPMEEGAWYINTYRGFGKPFKNINLDNNGYIQRVIASTDPKLETSDEMFHNTFKQTLPSPSTAFQEKYCKMGGINMVNVEYINFNESHQVNQVKGYEGDLPIPDDWRIKVDNHNTITIHAIKESYTPEELEECAMNAVYKMMFRSNNFPEDYKVKAKSFINDWINTNA